MVPTFLTWRLFNACRLDEEEARENRTRSCRRGTVVTWPCRHSPAGVIIFWDLVLQAAKKHRLRPSRHSTRLNKLSNKMIVPKLAASSALPHKLASTQLPVGASSVEAAAKKSGIRRVNLQRRRTSGAGQAPAATITLAPVQEPVRKSSVAHAFSGVVKAKAAKSIQHKVRVLHICTSVHGRGTKCCMLTDSGHCAHLRTCTIACPIEDDPRTKSFAERWVHWQGSQLGLP